MFDFGRDLRRLFDGERTGQDLGWLELIGVRLLGDEARRQTVDAGRSGTARPHPAWLLAAALWREHARRSGEGESLNQARLAAMEARKAARSDEDRAESALALAEALLLGHDLNGGPESLNRAESMIADIAGAALRPALQSHRAATHARIRSRRVRMGDEEALSAMALMDQAVHDLTRRHDGTVETLRLERAELVLTHGMERRDARLLDQAGRELRDLVEACPGETRPLTRARALALCGEGLCALAALAHDDQAAAQGQSLFEAAHDQFPADHSPMDWATVTLARHRLAPLSAKDIHTCALAAELARTGTLHGLALADLVHERAVAMAQSAGDLTALDGLAMRLRARLTLDRPRPAAWAVDQIGLSRIALARAHILDAEAGPLRLVLIEAETAAREEGANLIADRATRLLTQLPA